MNRKIILPCAGFGTRVGLAPDESKELLQLENEHGVLIDYAMKYATIFNAEAVVISRPEKKDLNSYLQYRYNVTPVLYKPTGEWAQTVFDSYEHWGDSNILLLPDTRWADPIATLEHTFFCLEKMQTPTVFGVHEVADSQNWCVKHGNYFLEKPVALTDKTNLAFGTIGFDRYIGAKLFSDLAKHKSYKVSTYSQYIKLNNFIDVGRGGYKLTKYEKDNRIVE